MNLVNSVLGIFILAILVTIGYKVAQVVIELNSPISPSLTAAEISVPEEQSSSTIRWNRLSLAVYIDDSFIRQNPDYVNDVKQALAAWQSTGVVSFNIVGSAEDADIIIEWAPSLKEKSLDTLGNTDIKFVNISQFGIIRNASIQLLTKSDSRQLNSIDMTNLALHEIGHAIGLQHTSTEDIMNPVLVVPSKTVKEISSQDMSNLQELYKAPAKPDLRISGVNATKWTFSRLGRDYFYLNISIGMQNAGLTDVDSFDVQLAADGSVVNESSYANFEIGDTLNIFQGNLRIEKNFTSIQVKLDPRNLIDELNEANNLVDIPV